MNRVEYIYYFQENSGNNIYINVDVIYINDNCKEDLVFDNSLFRLKNSLWYK